MTNLLLKFKATLLILVSFSFVSGQDAATKRELKRVNAKIDRENVRVDSLDTQIRMLLPELQNALKANLKAKEQTDSVAILLINRINTIQNKMRLMEDKAAYIDSVNFEILAQLVMIENKIVTLTNSFTEMYNLKNNKVGDKVSAKISPVEYKRIYIDALSAYQNGQFEKAVTGFAGLVMSDPRNDLADNSQYWLAECYYTMKNYKRAIIEFERVFTFPGTDKDDDAQLKLGHCHRSMGNIDKAREEYQRLIDYFPGSEFYEKARESLKHLNVQ
ncbi:MAG: tetratricopeptide repeat protein [Candidatus Marinimicrobia bacterium]|nr:tetratricopeptide repeat protein [Candidatus Neomarinimicrobiota bacterium]